MLLICCVRHLAANFSKGTSLFFRMDLCFIWIILTFMPISHASPKHHDTLCCYFTMHSCRWGLTETCGSGARSLPHDPTSSGTVGICSHSVELKLVDHNELGYSTDDRPNPRGELCVRGPSVFQYYYKGMYRPPSAFLGNLYVLNSFTTYIL